MSLQLVWIAAWLAVVAAAFVLRSRAYAIFLGIALGIQVMVWAAIFAGEPGWWTLPVFYLQAVTFVHFLSLVRPRMRGLGYRYLVSLPAHAFAAGSVLAVPWAVARVLGFEPVALWLPFTVALVGLLQSLFHRYQEVDVVLDHAPVDQLSPHPRGQERSDRPLRVVQITDPHLGPFMSERRLRRLCERAVARDPDLVFITGDFLTMESHHDVDVLARALSPLTALQGRVYACRGNHDHEAPETVAEACRRNQIRLLIDEEALVDTPAGPVQIVGVDYRFRDRQEHVERVCRRFPSRDDATRVVLLHDPGQFVHVPDEEQGALVLAGHTHGGQVGLVSLGLNWTFVRQFTSIPDHGYWAHGRHRLYVHRGSGHYGFPLRVGVPGEESLLRVHVVGS